MPIRTSGEYEENGAELLRTDRFAEALALFEEGVRHYPGDVDLTLGMAMAHLSLGESGRACAILDDLKRARPESEDILRALVEAYLTRDMTDAAVRAATEAIAHNPDAKTMNRFARVFYNFKRYAQALPFYERAAEAAPNWSEAWFGLGACQWAMNRRASAEAALRRAVELDPKDWLARQFFGCALSDMGRREEATRMLDSIPLDAPWQKPALERLVAMSWWPDDPARGRAIEELWRRVVGGTLPSQALQVLEEVSRPLDEK